MRILLVNPNRFKSPPTPPIGLEYTAGYLTSKGHEVKILDLCFSDNIEKAVDDAIETFKPNIAGLTVRNVDTVLFHTNEFFLDEIHDIVDRIKERTGIPVMIGGAGVAINPNAVCNYLNANHVFVGPAEGGLSEYLKTIEKSNNPERVVQSRLGQMVGCRRITDGIDYEKYFGGGGIAGFETHKGCSSSCVYCLEATSEVSFKSINDVILEIKGLVDRGFDHFHLCDSEFNEDLDYAVEFSRSLNESSLKISWAAYMQPAPTNDELFRLMRDSGAYLITLTVDSFRRKEDYWAKVGHFIEAAKASGIDIAVDFLTGLPGEDENLLLQCLDRLLKYGPSSVNINTYLRLYETLPISKFIMKNKDFHQSLLGNVDDRSMIKPVFYNQISAAQLKEIVKGESLFRIEGPEQGVNYRRMEENR
jgi:radical SAM superfamily enzyme YgiQ (UPF0313 family)